MPYLPSCNYMQIAWVVPDLHAAIDFRVPDTSTRRHLWRAMSLGSVATEHRNSTKLKPPTHLRSFGDVGEWCARVWQREK